MLRNTLALILLIAMPVGQAEAHHCFSVWSFPWPQTNCSGSHARLFRSQLAIVEPAVASSSRLSGAPSIGLPPPGAAWFGSEEDKARAAAVDVLRRLLSAPGGY